MFKFAIKKAFFNSWDNLFTLVVLNTISLLFSVGLFSLFTLITLTELMHYVVIFLAIILFSFFMGAVSGISSEIVNNKRPGLKSFFKNLKSHWKSSLIYALIIIVLERIFFIVLPYYFFSGSIISILLGTLIAWVAIILFLSSLYFLPVASQLKTGILKTLKISFTLLFDNTLFTLILGLWIFLSILISALTVSILPGILGILIITNTAVKLRLYKYDYIQKQKDNAKKIPWEDLLKEDTKLLGKRTLRGMIFPWKD